MGKLTDYMNLLTQEYGYRIEVAKSKYDEKSLAPVPPALREFYREYTTANFPFGEVYSIETAVEDSREEPFKSHGWFAFGFDGYFSYWLCRLTPDERERSFTSWDHEAGEINGAVYRDLEEFLAGEQEEYERNRNIGSVVLESLPDNKLSFIAKLRSAFSLTIYSSELMKSLDNLPYNVVADISYTAAKEKMGETGHPACFSFRSKPFV